LKHLVSSREHCPDPVTFTNFAFNQLQFNRLDPDIFPIPQFSLRARRPLEDLVDKFDFESGMGSAAPRLPPKTYVMAAGMNTGVRPLLPPKVWDSGEKFHPAAKELAAICEANMAKRPIGSPVPTREVKRVKEIDVKGLEFDEKILSPAAFRKFEEARATVKATSTGRIGPHGRLVGGDHVRVIPLGTSSALPSKYRNGMRLSFSPRRD
jgi:ribonuclease Z